MKKINLIFVFLSFSLALSSQTLALPSDGEGVNSRTDMAAFVIDPMVVQPSFFFSPAVIDTRPNRKWWRKTTASPMNYSAIKQSLNDSYAVTLANRDQLTTNPNFVIADPLTVRLWSVQKSATTPRPTQD